MLNRRLATSLIRAVLAAALVGAVGCATPVYRRDHGPIVGVQGSAYDTVLPGPKTALVEPGWELARNDDNLSLLTATDQLRRNAFSSLTRPSLDRPRHINLSRSSRRFIYFTRPRQGAPVYP